MVNLPRATSLLFAAMLAMLDANGAPPPGGMPTMEETVTRGCKESDLVFVAKVIRLREESRSGHIWETAELSLVSILKGRKERVPRTYSLTKKEPNVTDQIGDSLETGMTYLMFLKAHPPTKGWEGTIIRNLQYELLGNPGLPLEGRPMKKTDTAFQSALTLARKVCR